MPTTIDQTWLEANPATGTKYAATGTGPTLVKTDSTTATVTESSHGRVSGTYVIIAGITPSEYNGKKQVTVTTDNAYTYVLAGDPAAPSGTVTLTAFNETAMPIILDTQNETYTLGVGIAADYSAVLVGEEGVTLNTAGYDVTFGNAAALTITNGDFETGTVDVTADDSIAGWTFVHSGTSTGILRDNDTANFQGDSIFGTKVLSLENFDGTEYVDITSDSITVDAAYDGKTLGLWMSLASPNGDDYGVTATVTITRSGTTATVAWTSHPLVSARYVRISGAGQPEYNGFFETTYIDANSFSYQVSGSPATPATGTIKGRYFPIFQILLASDDSVLYTGWWNDPGNGIGETLAFLVTSSMVTNGIKVRVAVRPPLSQLEIDFTGGSGTLNTGEMSGDSSGATGIFTSTTSQTAGTVTLYNWNRVHFTAGETIRETAGDWTGTYTSGTQTGQENNIYLTNALVAPYGSAGCICSRTSGTDANAPFYANLPASPHQASYNAGARRERRKFTLTDSVGTTTWTQGGTSASHCRGLAARSSNGISVSDTEFVIGGVSPIAIDIDKNGYNAAWDNEGTYTGHLNSAVDNCTATMTATVDMEDRKDNVGAIRWSMYDSNDATHTLAITDNTVTNCGQQGIYGINGGATSTVNITGNAITGASIVTNGYGVHLGNAASGTTTLIDDNTITGDGRGISLDSLFGSFGMYNVTVSNNNVDVHETGNKEYSNTGISCTAFRFRNNIEGNPDVVDNIAITGNTFQASILTAADSDDIYGARITLEDTAGNDNANADITISNNTFKAIDEVGSGTTATAITLSKIHAGINLALSGNTFASNHRSVQIADSDGGGTTPGIYDVTFSNSTYEDSYGLSAEGADVVHVSMRIGQSTKPCDDVTFQGNVFTGGADNTIEWDGTGSRTIYEGDKQTVSVSAEWTAPPVLPGATVYVTPSMPPSASGVPLIEVTDGSGDAFFAVAYRKWVDEVNTITDDDILFKASKTGHVTIQSNIVPSITSDTSISIRTAM